MDDESSETFVPHRIVHLDLKGAPPKINYLRKIIPLLRQWGATGILVEYEDMFPFKEDLFVLSRPTAYTPDDLRLLQEVTKAEGMTYIPLLQSFGHVEFILKTKEFSYLREAAMNPMSLCPTHKDSLPLVEKIVDQYMMEHTEAEYLHIGGDEVFCLGICKECLETQQNNTQLFLSHMMPLIQLIRRKYPKLKVFVWDDMFRSFSVTDLEALGSSIIPMVWSYVDDLTGQFPEDMWRRYTDVFDEIWIASSYKGSSGPTCDMVPIRHHLDNHLSWLTLLNDLDETIRNKINGICFTGWTRYDHFATLCELLPISLPCLALCLQVFNEGKFSKEIHESVSKRLGFLYLIPVLNVANVRYDLLCANFPGSELLVYISQLESTKQKLLEARERFDGWLDSWHVEVLKEINFGHLSHISSTLNHAVQSYEMIKNPLSESLSFHFYEETVLEFIKVKIESKEKNALELLTKTEAIRLSCSQQQDHGKLISR